MDLPAHNIKLLVGAAFMYLADDCRLLSDIGRRPLRSITNDLRNLLMPRTHDKLGDRSIALWLGSTATGTVLRLLQTISEISNTWRLNRLVTFEFVGAIEVNLSVYLSIFNMHVHTKVDCSGVIALTSST